MGLIEGVAESTALVVKVFSGALSDRWRNRQGIAAAGYGLAAFSKPLFALATGPGLVFAARFLDRIGKGIRGAPRDALIADLAPKEIRGAAFGLRQTLDTVGAFAGPLAAIGLMLAWNDNFRAVFWIAVIPAIASFLLIAFGVREPDAPQGDGEAKAPVRLDRATLRALGAAFWGVTAAGAALTLARFSEAFLVLRASDLQLAEAYAPAVLVVMNVVFSLVAYPVGKLADRMAPRVLLLLGAWRFSLLPMPCWRLPAASASRGSASRSGDCTWVSRRACSRRWWRTRPPRTCAGRRSACSISRAASRCWSSSVLAGALWTWVGPAATFWAGAFFALACGAITRMAVH